MSELLRTDYPYQSKDCDVANIDIGNRFKNVLYDKRNGLNSIQPLILWAVNVTFKNTRRENIYVEYDQSDFFVNSVSIPGESIGVQKLKGVYGQIDVCVPTKRQTDNTFSMDIFVDVFSKLEHVYRFASMLYAEKHEIVIDEISVVQYMMENEDPKVPKNVLESVSNKENTIYRKSTHKPVICYKFHECAPISISELRYDHKDQSWGRTRNVKFVFGKMKVYAPYYDDMELIGDKAFLQSNMIADWLSVVGKNFLTVDTPIFNGNGLQNGLSKASGFLDSLFYKEPKIKGPSKPDATKDVYGNPVIVGIDTADTAIGELVDPNLVDIDIRDHVLEHFGSGKLVDVDPNDHTNGVNADSNLVDVDPNDHTTPEHPDSELVEVPYEDHVIVNDPDYEWIRPDDKDHIENNMAYGEQVPIEKNDHILDNHAAGDYVPVDKNDSRIGENVESDIVPIDRNDHIVDSHDNSKQISIDKNDHLEKSHESGDLVAIGKNDHIDKTHDSAELVPVSDKDHTTKEHPEVEIVNPDRNDHTTKNHEDASMVYPAQNDKTDGDHPQIDGVYPNESDKMVSRSELDEKHRVDPSPNDTTNGEHSKFADLASIDNQPKMAFDGYEKVDSLDSDHTNYLSSPIAMEYNNVDIDKEDRIGRNGENRSDSVKTVRDTGSSILDFANMFVKIKNPHEPDTL